MKHRINADLSHVKS